MRGSVRAEVARLKPERKMEVVRPRTAEGREIAEADIGYGNGGGSGVLWTGRVVGFVFSRNGGMAGLWSVERWRDGGVVSDGLALVS